MFFASKTKQNKTKWPYFLCVSFRSSKTLKNPSPKHSKFFFQRFLLCSSKASVENPGLSCGLGRSLREIQVGQKGPGMSVVIQLPCDLRMGSVNSYRAKGTCQMRSVLSVSLHGAGRPLRPPGAPPKWR